MFSYFQERKQRRRKACRYAVGCVVRVPIHRMEYHQVQYTSNTKVMDRSKRVAISRRNLVTSIRATVAESKSRLPPNPNDFRHFAYDLDNRELIARSIKTSQPGTRPLREILTARRSCPFRRTRDFDRSVPNRTIRPAYIINHHFEEPISSCSIYQRKQV
jgi:hypothetical protein